MWNEYLLITLFREHLNGNVFQQKLYYLIFTRVPNGISAQLHPV